MFEIHFIGTAAAVPSKERAMPCVAVKSGPDMVLFDCGEGTQRQLMLSRFSFMKVKAVLVTHMHGDHFYGLPGLMQTMGMADRKDPLLVVGPKGIKNAVEACLSVCEGQIGYEVDIRELGPGDTFSVGSLSGSVFKTEHGLPSQGYIIREPDSVKKIDKKKADALGLEGRDFAELNAGGTVKGVCLRDILLPSARGLSVAYTGDTMKCSTVDEAVKGVDVLIHEATYVSADERLAVQNFHSTARSAAETARDCGVGTLLLTHLSNRYKSGRVIETDARAVFENTYVPDDLALFHLTKSGFRSV